MLHKDRNTFPPNTKYILLCIEVLSASQELARLGGNAIALRAAAVAIITLMKSIDPALLQRYLQK
jgi:hypothetical protein